MTITATETLSIRRVMKSAVEDWASSDRGPGFVEHVMSRIPVQERDAALRDAIRLLASHVTNETLRSSLHSFGAVRRTNPDWKRDVIVQSEYARLLTQRIPTEDGAGKLLADAFREDLLYMAELRRQHAQAALTEAARWQSLAAKLPAGVRLGDADLLVEVAEIFGT